MEYTVLAIIPLNYMAIRLLGRWKITLGGGGGGGKNWWFHSQSFWGFSHLGLLTAFVMTFFRFIAIGELRKTHFTDCIFIACGNSSPKTILPLGPFHVSGPD